MALIFILLKRNGLFELFKLILIEKNKFFQKLT